MQLSRALAALVFFFVAAFAVTTADAARARRKPPKRRPAATATRRATPTPTPTPTPRPAEAGPTPTPVPLDCDAVKTRLLGGSKACPQEARAAATIPCSAGGHAKLLALDLACTRTTSPDEAKASPLAETLDSGNCRAISLEDGSLLAEATSPDYQGCARALQAQLLADLCTGDAKQVDYLFLRGTHAPYAFTVRCP